MHRGVWLKKIRALDEQQEKLRGQLVARKKSLEDTAGKKVAASEREAALRQKLADTQRREEDLRIAVAEKESANDAFDVEYAATLEEYNALRRETEADEVVKQAAAAAQASQKETQRRVDDAKREADAAAEKANMMEAKIRESKQAEWREQVKRDGAEAAELRRNRDELRRKLDELQARKGELQAVVDKRQKKH
ncbi:kinesin [Trypanosoma grayi]|uniref:kinesin n=1 Tax=Trypanosoma grayi TaxID=71804 RepID=UPI0004F46DBC|nr:kinesin [Trypanosoma grayi]KEG07469.1 kinesin [Trypanosoma grayi]